MARLTKEEKQRKKEQSRLERERKRLGWDETIPGAQAPKKLTPEEHEAYVKSLSEPKIQVLVSPKDHPNKEYTRPEAKAMPEPVIEEEEMAEKSDSPVAQEEPQEVLEEKVEEAPAKEAEESEEAEEAAKEASEEPNEEAEDEEEVEAPSEDDEVEDETPASAKEKNGPSAGAPYHLSKRVSDGKWQLFIAGSDKVMKTFNTKVEAEEYTYALAAKTGRKVLVHKSKGANKGKVSKARN